MEVSRRTLFNSDWEIAHVIALLSCELSCNQVDPSCKSSSDAAELRGPVSTGLFRKPEATSRAKKRRRKAVMAVGGAVTLGSLDDLRSASKGGIDPSGASVATPLPASLHLASSNFGLLSALPPLLQTA